MSSSLLQEVEIVYFITVPTYCVQDTQPSLYLQQGAQYGPSPSSSSLFHVW